MKTDMMKCMIGIVVAISLALVGACSKDKDDKAAPADQPTAPAPGDPTAKSPTPGDVARPEANIPDEDLPVETDFEDEADSQITAANYMQELESLEKEISADE